MPKVPRTDSTAIVTLLNENLAKLNWLLEGNLDDDNLYEDGSGNTLKIPSKKILDFADDTRLVRNMKFFGSESNVACSSVTEKIWTPLINMIQDNKEYIVVRVNANWILSNLTTPPPQKKKRSRSMLSKIAGFATGSSLISGVAGAVGGKDAERRLGKISRVGYLIGDISAGVPGLGALDFQQNFNLDTSVEEDVSEENIYSKRLIINKPPNIAAVKDGNGEIRYNVQKFMVAKNYSTSKDDLRWIIEDPEETYDEISIECSLELEGLEANEYVTCELEFSILCEVLP